MYNILAEVFIPMKLITHMPTLLKRVQTKPIEKSTSKYLSVTVLIQDDLKQRDS